MPRPPSIVVVGSINIDLVARMRRLPKPGETVSGEIFQTIPGGKGANQAIAAARLGAQVKIVGRVGDDEFAGILRKNLVSDGIDTTYVIETRDCASGVAMIGVEVSGANSIVVIPGANGKLSVADIELCRATISSADALIVQLETPISTVRAAIGIARERGVLTVLDPAPVPSEKLPSELFSVDVISPNQTEAEELVGVPVHDWESAGFAAVRLQKLGAKNVVVKLGSLGALVCTQDGAVSRVLARSAEIVDTTAAGDAFTAAMAVAICEGRSLVDSVKFGTLAGTLACTKFGAQPSMPTRSDVDRWNEGVA